MNPKLEILDKVTDVVLAYRPKSMDELSHIANQGGDIYVDSREIATLFGVQHDNFMQLIGKNEEALNQLGQLLFETGKPIRGATMGGRPQKYAWLNFDQIVFLLTLTRTTPVNREYRLRLVIMFRNARKKLRPVDGILLSIPTAWKLTFTPEFYTALLQLYGDSFDASKNKPSWVGRWTNRYIYEPIFAGLSAELKAKRTQFGTDSGKETEYLKLHQFLEENAKEALRDHKSKITGFLQIAKTRQEFRESFAALFGGGKQGLLGDEFD